MYDAFGVRQLKKVQIVEVAGWGPPASRRKFAIRALDPAVECVQHVASRRFRQASTITSR